LTPFSELTLEVSLQRRFNKQRRVPKVPISLLLVRQTAQCNLPDLIDMIARRTRRSGSWLFDSDRIGRMVWEALKMNQNAKRNLQRRKRQAMRLAKREYFRKKKEASTVSAAEKDKV
jgi:hypothetical protein